TTDEAPRALDREEYPACTNPRTDLDRPPFDCTFYFFPVSIRANPVSSCSRRAQTCHQFGSVEPARYYPIISENGHFQPFDSLAPNTPSKLIA
ncbi:hypothetical protein T265_14553, partial [Opisthorchis viverrini]